MAKKRRKQGSTLQFHFMPHLQIEEPIHFGRYIIWPYDESLIANQTIQKAVSDRLATMQSYYGRPIEKIAMISYRKRDCFTVLGDRHINEVRLIARVLFFVGLEKVAKRAFDGRNDRQIHNWCTADNFLVIHQNFIPDSDWMAPSNGGIHTIKDMGEVSEIRFTTPGYINSDYHFDYDEEVLGALHTCYKGRKHAAQQRILTAVEWLYQAYHNTSDIRIGSRIVMLSTAFEALLEIPFYEKKKEFGKKIEAIARTSKDRTTTFPLHSNDPSKSNERGSKKKNWAYRFYELRNKIVHEGKAKSKGYKFRGMHHFFLGEMFLIQSIKQKLSSIKSIKYKNYDKILSKTKPVFIMADGHWDKIKEEIFSGKTGAR